MADITLADFWGIEKYNRKLEKNLGTSLVMINSQKGRAYFQNIQEKIRAIPMPFETILPGNMALVRSLESPRVEREKFFHDVDQLPFTKLSEKYILHPNLTTHKKIKLVLKKVLSFVRFGKIWMISHAKRDFSMMTHPLPEERGRVSNSLAATTHSSGATRHLP